MHTKNHKLAILESPKLIKNNIFDYDTEKIPLLHINKNQKHWFIHNVRL